MDATIYFLWKANERAIEFIGLNGCTSIYFLWKADRRAIGKRANLPFRGNPNFPSFALSSTKKNQSSFYGRTTGWLLFSSIVFFLFCSLSCVHKNSFAIVADQHKYIRSNFAIYQTSLNGRVALNKKNRTYVKKYLKSRRMSGIVGK